MRRTFDLTGLTAYEILESRPITDLNSDSYLLRHLKTGARVALLSNDDDNKVFYIGFRTPPKDSTGVAHIVEHTVLCGSKEFPLKDPFVELAKGSLNTFLNAMTYPDKTVYPIASCNDADFRNLMHVYLDAVLYPNIYHEERIFRQEGWHYEMETPDDDLKINGVVYNEMKGAYSSPDEVLERYIKHSLFPDTTYGIESGGDPDDIPDLTYEAFLDFHRRYYHPSNSYIYLYGDMDMEEQLRYIDEHYLSHFDALTVDSEVTVQKTFDAPKEVTKTYACLSEEEEQDGTYLSYNVKLEDSLDKELYIAFSTLDYALCSSPGAVVKKALIEAGIGEDVYSSYTSEFKQPTFSIIAKNANTEQKDEFVEIIRKTLTDAVQKGLDKRTLLAALNVEEFQYREADFGRFPRGLAYGLQMLDSWLHDDRAAWNHIEANATYASLKEKVKTHYFEDLVEKYLLDNPHRVVLQLVPKAHLNEEKEAALVKALAEKKAAMTTEEVQAVVDATASLRAFQEEEPTKEALESIPLLRREDLRKEAEPFVYEERRAGDVPVLFHHVNTYGIDYLMFSFDLSTLPEEYADALPVLKAVLTMMDTAQFSYAELNNEIDLYTGGMSVGISTYADAVVPEKNVKRFEVGVKVLHTNLEKAFALTKEVLTATRFTDTGRLKEILDEIKAQLSAALPAGGHQTAAVRALSYQSEAAAFGDRMSGIGALRTFEHWAAEKDLSPLAELLQKTAETVFRKENLLVDITGTENEYEGVEACSVSFAKDLFTVPCKTGTIAYTPEKKNEAFVTGGQVQYVARAGNFRKKGLPYHGGLAALRVIMGLDYLWGEIRVKGGAYGCMSNYTRTGNCFFATYRDPHLQRSIEVFEKAADYLRNFTADDRTILKYIIGTLSELDMPKTPSQKGMYGMSAYFTHVTHEQLQKERDELMGMDVALVRSLAKYIDAFLDEGYLCAVGSAGKVEAHKDLFAHVEELLQG